MRCCIASSSRNYEPCAKERSFGTHQRREAQTAFQRRIVTAWTLLVETIESDDLGHIQQNMTNDQSAVDIEANSERAGAHGAR